MESIDHTLLSILTVVTKILKILEQPEPNGHFAFSVGMAVPKEKKMPLELTITNEEKIDITVKPITSTGKPATLDGSVIFSVTSGAGTIEGIDDKSAFLVSPDSPGDTTYLVEADADLGSGVETISDTVLLHVEGAKAINLGLTSGSPVPK